jgi:prepilin-type N-terminal cleavage/methylation domain-containing protein
MKPGLEYPVHRSDVAGRIGVRPTRGSRAMPWRSGADAALRRAGEGAKPDGSPHRQAFTLIEMMVATGLFSLVIVAILACHLAGLRFQQLIEPKLLHAQYERQTLGRLIEEARCANSLQVGTGSLSAFTAAGPTNIQAGNALRIYTSTNTSQYIYYFHDLATATVQRVPLQGTSATIIASAVTNHTIFTMQDFAGNALTNSQNNAVMSLWLQFYVASAWQGIADSAQVRTKVTRRNLL